jgi:hypothetical protein
MVATTGFLAFAPATPARGPLFSARTRARVAGTPAVAAPLNEEDL